MIIRYLITAALCLSIVGCGTKESVHYECEGTGDQTIVFVHGLGCDTKSWEKQRGAFENAKEIFIDLPGFGQSDKPEIEYTLEEFASAVISVMDKTNTRKAVLVGHSLGTAVCREVALEHPDRVTALIDIDGVYCLYPKDTTTQEYRDYCAAVNQFAESFNSDSVSVIFTNFVSSLAGPSTPEYITEYALSVMPQTPKYVAYSTMKNLIKPQYWTGEKIVIPTVVICTQNSGLMPDNKERMEALYPDMKYYELEKCGHFIQMEESRWVNSIIDSTLFNSK